MKVVIYFKTNNKIYDVLENAKEIGNDYIIADGIELRGINKEEVAFIALDDNVSVEGLETIDTEWVDVSSNLPKTLGEQVQILEEENIQLKTELQATQEAVDFLILNQTII